MATEQTRRLHLANGDVNFDVLINGSWVPCRISCEALSDHFAATPSSVLIQVFRQNESGILAKAREIHRRAANAVAARFNDQNRLLIKTGHFLASSRP